MSTMDEFKKEKAASDKMKDLLAMLKNGQNLGAGKLLKELVEKDLTVDVVSSVEYHVVEAVQKSLDPQGAYEFLRGYAMTEDDVDIESQQIAELSANLAIEARDAGDYELAFKLGMVAFHTDEDKNPDFIPREAQFHVELLDLLLKQENSSVALRSDVAGFVTGLFDSTVNTPAACELIKHLEPQAIALIRQVEPVMTLSNFATALQALPPRGQRYTH